MRITITPDGRKEIEEAWAKGFDTILTKVVAEVDRHGFKFENPLAQRDLHSTLLNLVIECTEEDLPLQELPLPVEMFLVRFEDEILNHQLVPKDVAA